MNIHGNSAKKQNGQEMVQAQELATLTRELSRCCQDKEERICRSFGLHSADGRILVAIQRGNLKTSSAIAEYLGIGNSRVTPLIDRLAQKGLVIRSESERDRRTKRLDLTSAGRAIAVNLQGYEEELHERLLAHFPAEKRKEILDILRTLKAAMELVRNSIES